jgi:hypothetical protein
MDLSRGIHPLTDLKVNTPESVRQLMETGQLPVLTINGKAKILVQDVRLYRRLVDRAERLETIQAVKEGLASMQRGECREMDQVFGELEKILRLTARP